MPHIVGYQCAGTIREVGEGVTDRHVGQRVVAHEPLGLARRAASRCPRSSPGRSPTAPTSSRSRACRSRSAPPTTASSSSATCRRARPCSIQAGAGGVGIAAIQLAKRAGATVIATASSDDRLERAQATSASTTASTTRTTTGSTRCARSPAAAASTSSSTRSAARSSPGSVACLAYRGRCITVGSAGRDPQPFDVGVLGDGQPVAHRRVPRRRDHDAARAGDDRRASSTTSRPAACTSRSTARTRSPRPPPRTRTSRAAKPSAASSSSRRPCRTGVTVRGSPSLDSASVTPVRA